MSDVGGSCFDDAVLAHVLDVAPPEDHGAEPDEIRRGLAQLRQGMRCGQGRVVIRPRGRHPVGSARSPDHGPTDPVRVRGMIDQQIERTCDALEDLLEDSGTSMDEVDAILPVGAPAP